MRSQLNPFAALALAVVVAGCGGKSENDSSSTGGAAGSSGSGATGGGAGSGGQAGSGGTSGAAGSGGSIGSGPECKDSGDCKLWSDCCTCTALAPGEPEPPACLATCLQDACSAMGLKGGQATCAAGKCVVGFDCDADKVFCNALPPLCEGGMTPSVNGGCWGPCVPVSECASIPTCADCTAPGTVCVTVDMQSGDSAASHCVEVPKGCEGSPTCACMGSSVCPAPFSACFDQKQPSGLLCSCPNC